MKLYTVLDPANGMTQWVTDTVTFRTRITNSTVASVGVNTFGWTPLGWDAPAILGPEWSTTSRNSPSSGPSAAPVLAAVDWDQLVPAGAFVLGAALATLATIRIVRAVTMLFEGSQRPLRGRRRRANDDDGPTPP